MATNEKKRQQKLMKKRRKQKDKQKKALGGASSSNTENAIIRRAHVYPIHECLLSEKWEEEGMAAIAIARRQSEAQILLGVYVVDLYCLGVKNTFCIANMPLSKYREDFRARYTRENGARPCSAELAHQIIYGAVEYAANLGFRPHKGFLLSRHMLNKRETVPPNNELEFGRDGKPLYFSGPRDSPGRILKHLEARLGKEGFHYIVATGSPEDYDDMGDYNVIEH